MLKITKYIIMGYHGFLWESMGKCMLFMEDLLNYDYE